MQTLRRVMEDLANDKTSDSKYLTELFQSVITISLLFGFAFESSLAIFLRLCAGRPNLWKTRFSIVFVSSSESRTMQIVF